MDRGFTYSGQIPLETDLLHANQNALIAIAKIAELISTNTFVYGLPCTQSATPAMSVLVGAGQIYMQQPLEASSYSSLPADTAHTIQKQGISLDAVTVTGFAAPSTAGDSVNYLIQATYQDSDTGSTVLPYYNSSSPNVPWNGPNNSGSAQPTMRKGIVVLSAKAGSQATTGTQITPPPDSGYVGLYVVTITHGQTTIINSNISLYPSAPYIYSYVDFVNILQSSAGSGLVGDKKSYAWAKPTTVGESLENKTFNIIADGGCAGDDSTDDYINLQNVFTNCPSGITLDFGDETKIYRVSSPLTCIGKDIYFNGSAKIIYTGSASPNAVLTITDVPNRVEFRDSMYFDAGGNALNGLSVEADTVSNSDYIFLGGVRGGNTASDPSTLSRAAIRVQALGGAGSSIRPKNVIAARIKTYSCGTHGFLPAYVDGVFIYGGSRFENAENHGWESVRCTNVIATHWHAEACGKSGGGVGDGTIGFEIAHFSTNLCAGDASFTVEHNCNNGSVHDFKLTNCFTSAINVSYGSSSNAIVNVKDISVFNGRATAHASNTTTPGVNCYGTSGAGMSDNVNIYDVTVDGFNRGADYLFQKNGKCDVTFKNPTGSGTYVVKGQLVINCDIWGKCDYTVSDNAYQIISYSGLDSFDCRIVGHVKQAGATSNMAVVTIDGAGTGFIVTAHTGGANNYLYLQAGASAVLCNSTGPLNGDPWAGECNPVASYGNAINSMDFSVVGGQRIFSAANNAGSPNFTGHIPPNTTPYFRDADMTIPVAYSSGTPREWRYKVATTSWVSQGNFL